MATATVASSSITITATPSSTPTTCGAGTGTATVTPTNGVAPYTYLWSGARTGATITGLNSGNYNVTITDANGCRGIFTAINVANPSAPTATLSSTDVACFGNSTGAATISATGGTTPYTFTWSNSSSITNTATALAAGNFSATVNDANNCATVVSGDIDEPIDAVSITVTGTNGDCQGQAGMAVATATGGTGAFTYGWSNTDDSTIIFNLNAGTYMVTATDANGCMATGMTTITGGAGVLAAVAASTDASAAGAADGAANLTVTGGRAPFTYAWSNGATTEDISGLVAATYTVTVTDGNGCTADTSVVISQPVGVVGATAQAMSLRLFPNPAQQTATLELSVLSTSQVNIEVYNVTGQVLFSQNAEQIGTQQYQLPVANFAQGVYFVKVRAAGNTATQRLIISRD
jgi:hypothetical protein